MKNVDLILQDSAISHQISLLRFSRRKISIIGKQGPWIIKPYPLSLRRQLN